ncbi:MAG: hypothetical protein ACP5NV_01540 [Candidatus Woesearchaeota archaeon]
MLVASIVLLAGCSKVYVCYDGTEKKLAYQCPVMKTEITEQEAGKAMDNYGTAVAQAKGDSFTRVNLYQKNVTWYSGVLFTNKQTQTVTEATFRIDGKTGTVTCETGCAYVDFK